MTEDELDIETLRFRAPVVVPLSEGRLAVLTPGMDRPYYIVGHQDIHNAVQCYVEWNQLEAAKHVNNFKSKGVAAVPLEDLATLHDTLKQILGD